MHVYEVVGEVILRRSGNSAIPVRCQVIRTRAMLKEDGYVQISSLGSGFSNDTRMPEWFPDWSEADNMADQFGATGRAIDIAVPLNSIEHVAANGTVPPMVHAGKRVKPFYGEFAAVLIDGRWIEPEIVPQHMRMP
jgi:hypothetical protein